MAKSLREELSSIKRKIRCIECNESNSETGGIQSIQEGDNITVDNTDPLNPIVNSTGGSEDTLDDVAIRGSNSTVPISAGDPIATLFTDPVSSNMGYGNINNAATGVWNTYFGLYALQGVTTGFSNIAFGGSALYANTTGNNNVAIGSEAGRTITTGSNNIVIGQGQDVTPAVSFQLNIGGILKGNMVSTIGVKTLIVDAKLQLTPSHMPTADGTYTKTIVAKPDGAFGWEDKISSEFVKITQGLYIGFGLKGRVDNPTYYSPIGENSIDMGFQDVNSLNYPHIAVKMGTRSLSIGGIYNSVSGDESVVIGGGNSSVTGSLSVSVGGLFNTVTGDRSAILGGQSNTASNFCSSVLGGVSNVASGYYSLATGAYNSAKSYGETVIGVAATEYTPNSSTNSNPNDRLFVVGNGTNTFNRSNAFTILKNGLATLPSVTNALINSEATGKVIVTKEWINLRVPQPPATGTFVLKSIDGITSWVADV